MSKARVTARIRVWIERILSVKKESWIFCVQMIVLILLCILHSISAGHYADFFPINGTFQNFNPVRRFLDGQIPYRDFQDYLGIGHLYTGSLMTMLYGGNYRSSLQAFSFLTFAGLGLLSLMVGMAVFGKKETAAAMTGIILSILLIQPIFFTNAFAGTEEILEAFVYALGTGNSARFVRGMCLPVAVFLIYTGFLVGRRLCAKYRFLEERKEVVAFCGIGLVAGFVFVWSNDYGISCWLCLMLISFWQHFSRTRKFLRSIMMMLLALLVSLAAVFFTVEILTFGQIGAWFSAIFGTGGYQSWYYNSHKSYYLYDIDITYLMLLQAGLVIVYMIKLWLNRGKGKAICRYGILAFANMVCFCAVNEYKMLSGGTSREVALSVLFLTVVFELIHWIGGGLERKKAIRKIVIVSLLLCLSWIGATAKEEFIFFYLKDKDGIYVEQMGGNLTATGEDLLRTDEFLAGESFWATYASAQEVVSHTYQPSGNDYIIHVLGDAQRERYLAEFQEGNFVYAATIKETLTDYEYWVQRANWFFYRELYQNWHPVYGNSYELYWERNKGESNHIVREGYELTVVDLDESNKKLIVRCDSEINGTADVFMDYEVRKKDNTSAKIAVRTLLKVQNTGTVYADGGPQFESNYLRNKSAEHIPIPIVNGYGEVTISANPKRSTYLQLNEYSCDSIYTVASDYVEIAGITEDGQSCRITKNDKNSNAIRDIDAIELDGERYLCKEVKHEDAYIYITVDRKIRWDAQRGNQIRLIRQKEQGGTER